MHDIGLFLRFRLSPSALFALSEGGLNSEIVVDILDRKLRAAIDNTLVILSC